VQLAAETVEVVRMALALVGRDASSESVTYRELYRRELGLDPMTAPDEALRNALAHVTIDPEGLVRDDWLDLLMTHRIQPGLSPHRILVVRDYPASQCALARIRQPVPATEGDLPVAERFELYLGPLELANGYHELADADEQRARFERDLMVRRNRAAPAPAVDARLLDALAHGLPACAGVALGVDRLLMAMSSTPAIADVLAFDFTRA
jgi:lysyl-tRNA synthetase class 2